MRRRFGRLMARPPTGDDERFLAALYLDARPDLGALPVPRGVIEGIARHQQQLQRADYAQRFPEAEAWVVEEQGIEVGRLVLDRSGEVLRVVDLTVALKARRRGVAKELLRALQAEASAIALRVRQANVGARALYGQLGFTIARSDGAALELHWQAQNE